MVSSNSISTFRKSAFSRHKGAPSDLLSCSRKMQGWKGAAATGHGKPCTLQLDSHSWDVTYLAWNWQRWEDLHHWHWQTLELRALSPPSTSTSCCCLTLTRRLHSGVCHHIDALRSRECSHNTGTPRRWGVHLRATANLSHNSKPRRCEQHIAVRFDRWFSEESMYMLLSQLGYRRVDIYINKLLIFKISCKCYSLWMAQNRI